MGHTASEESLELPFRGELIVHNVCREVREHDAYFVISDTDNENFYWGNYIHFKNVPTDLSIEALERLYERELSHIKGHFIFTWSDDLDLNFTPDSLKALFVRAGYEFDASVCLISSPATVNNDIPRTYDVRAIETEKDWRKALDNQLVCRDREGGEEHIFKRMGSARNAVEQGHGCWMGAFEDEKLVGDLGIFWSGNQCRFQAIGTHPGYRRRGIARQMVVETIRRVSRRMADPTFIILTGLNSVPQKLYEQCGFEPVSNHVGMTKLTGHSP